MPTTWGLWQAPGLYNLALLNHVIDEVWESKSESFTNQWQNKVSLKDSFSGTEVKFSVCLIPVFNTYSVSSLTLKDIAETTAKVIAAQQKSLDSLVKVVLDN